eukprot:TRINITY_DN11557_c0_g1_i2.p1 TRINITY_DN11557_c0_g1~~TRINITY_DN11557_c0_g1_i2.p1  ORF type:complete len:152 (+),score=19.98 TRINITY_DN11557_c0_g1_i2:234-689(+)
MECAACPDERPYAHDNQCVAQCPAGRSPEQALKLCVCPPGKIPNALNICEECHGLTPYADHAKQRCVNQCGPGAAASEDRDCQACEGMTPYAIEINSARLCVRSCPPERPPSLLNECTLNLGNQSNVNNSSAVQDSTMDNLLDDFLGSSVV